MLKAMLAYPRKSIPTSTLKPKREEIALLYTQLGGEPSASVSADVSGRHPGDERIRDFVYRFLSQFEGLEQDEHTQGSWTLDAIRFERNIVAPIEQQRRSPILRRSPWG
jgi:hypothetical protein